MKKEDLIQTLSALSEPTRLQILFCIASGGELRAKDILKEFDITQPTLSHHLNLLIERELISSRKDGRCVWYSVNSRTTKEISDLILKLNDPKSLGKVSSAKTAAKKAPAVKKSTSVPKTKQKIAAPEITPVKKKKKKDKEKDKKKKDKKKKK